jgi:hypothetical protein
LLPLHAAVTSNSRVIREVRIATEYTKQTGWWIAAVGALFAYTAWGESGFDGYHLPKELFLCAGAAIAVWSWRSVDRVDAIWLGWLAIFTVSCVFATNSWLALRQWAIAAAGVALFVSTRGLDEATRERRVRYTVVLLGVLALFGVLESYGVLYLSKPGYAPGATLGQRNTLAHLLVLGLPWAWALMIREGRRWAIAIALGLAAVLLTRSRASYLAAPVALLVTLALSGKPPLRAAFGLAAAAGGLAAVALTRSALNWNAAHPYADSFARLFDASHGSGLGRVVQAHASVSLLTQHPLLGIGPGNWAVGYPSVTPPHDPTFFADLWAPTGRLVNSDWVAVMAEQGALGIAVALAAGALTLAVLVKSPATWRAPAAGSLAALVVLGSLDVVLQLAPAVMLLSTLLAVALPRNDARPLPRVAGAAFTAVLLLCCVRQVLQLEALRRLSHPEWGFASLETAARLDPANFGVHTTLTELYLGHGDCTSARPHLEALTKQYPNHPRIAQAARACP